MYDLLGADVSISCHERLSQTVNEVECDKAKEKFVPGGIHTPEAIQFWKAKLKANSWVMEVLENGYIMPFVRAPEKYEEDNNLSAKKHMDFVQETITAYKAAGIVQFVDQTPWCVSPLTVAEGAESGGVKKLRLCWDGSRCVNLCLKEQNVTLAHLQRA